MQNVSSWLFSVEEYVNTEETATLNEDARETEKKTK